MRIFVLAMVILGLLACKESSSGSGEGAAVVPTGIDDNSVDEDLKAENPVVRQRPDEVKTFMDYCLEEPEDPELAKTVEILKELVNEKFCGIVSGRLSRLDAINLNFRQITDIRPLRGLTGLKTLDLGNNSISDIAALSTLSGLLQLGLQANPVEDFSPLSNLNRLQRLILTGTNIKNVSEISKIKSLRALDLGRTDVVQLTGLGNLTSLEELSIALTDVEDITELSTLVKLQTLNLSGSRVENLSPIADLVSLTSLDLGGTVFMNQDFVKNNNNCPVAASSPAVAAICAIVP